MSLNEYTVRAAIQTVVDPNTGKDLVSAKAIKHLKIDGGRVLICRASTLKAAA